MWRRVYADGIRCGIRPHSRSGRNRECTEDNDNEDSWKSFITVKNTGDDVTGYDVWQSWVDVE